MWRSKPDKRFVHRLHQKLFDYGEIAGWNITQTLHGQQILDRLSAKLLSKLRFWRPVYVYAGAHWDFKGLFGLELEEKRCGIVRKIILRDSYAEVVIDYTEEMASAFLTDSKLRLSPCWQGKDVGQDKYRPIKLLSLATTYNPNIVESGELLENNI
nr:MAG TPA: hypothetical protein [Caudoviricetes sp.]